MPRECPEAGLSNAAHACALARSNGHFPSNIKAWKVTCRIELVGPPARILAGIPFVLADVAAVIAMVPAVITTLHSTTACEGADGGGKACEKREAQDEMLRQGAGCSRFHVLFSLGVGFAKFGRVNGKDFSFREPRLRYWPRWECFAAGKLLIAFFL
jgi:hypothetical protein